MGTLRFLVLCVLYGAAAWVSTAAEAPRGVTQLREYRKANEPRIVRELVDLLAIPNVARDRNLRGPPGKFALVKALLLCKTTFITFITFMNLRKYLRFSESKGGSSWSFPVNLLIRKDL